MSGIVSTLKPGWSGTVIGGFKESAIEQTLGELGFSASSRGPLMERVRSAPPTATWTDRHDAHQLEHSLGRALDPGVLRNLLGRLTRRQDAAAEVAVSLTLGSAALLSAGDPATGLLGAILCGVNASLASKPLFSRT